MEAFKNLDRALVQVKSKKGVDPDLEITDGDGNVIANPTKEDLMVLKQQRSDYLKRTQKPKGQALTDEVYQNTGIVEDAFGPNAWVDQKGRLKPIPEYDTPEELVRKIMEWENIMLRRMKSGSSIIPDTEGLVLHLGVSPGVVRGWRRGERGEAFKNIIEIEINKIAAVKNQLAMGGAIPQVVWATMMNNQHGYTQNSKMEIDVTAKRTPESSETLIKSANLLP
jgi:hypothetical protein